MLMGKRKKSDQGSLGIEPERALSAAVQNPAWLNPAGFGCELHDFDLLWRRLSGSNHLRIVEFSAVLTFARPPGALLRWTAGCGPDHLFVRTSRGK